MSEQWESGSRALDTWHEDQGAVWSQLDERRLVADYGEAAVEAAALRAACGLLERRWTETLRVEGEDRARFLNGYLTCDVATLESGSATYGFFTDAQGRILSDARITATGEVLRVGLPTGRARPLIDHLTRYVIADRVELSAASDLLDMLLVGPSALRVLLEGGDLEQLPAGKARTLTIAGVDVDAAAEGRLAVPAIRVTVPADGALAVAEELASRGAVPAGFDAFETLRIEAGQPRYGADFDDSNFPQETGLDDAISYTKGCYLGQEVVARIHYRGHVNRQLRSLVIEGDVAPPIGAMIEFENQRVGRLGSRTFSENAGHCLGLAILHRKAAEAGQRVEIEGGFEGRVEAAGFAAERDSTAV